MSIPSEWIFFIGVAALAFSLHVPLSSVILFWNQTRDTVIVIQFCVPSQRREEEILKKVWGTKLPPPLPVLLHRIVCLFSLSWSSRPSTDRHHSYLPIGTEWHFVLAYRILETYLANAQVIFSIAGFSAKWQQNKKKHVDRPPIMGLTTDTNILSIYKAILARRCKKM